jgi:XTP/dITP diphosphohydrolase
VKRILIHYATRSDFKRQEISVALNVCDFSDADNRLHKIGERFDIQFSDVPTDEPLEIDLVAMVRHKAVSAYKALLMPCIVEHAGLVLKSSFSSGFPGGLTQPMWDALTADGFLERTGAAGQAAVARAVFGYCDGMAVHTYVGETEGSIADKPRGDRKFYWDTVFCPGGYGGATYAEISGDPGRGIPEKMKVSQSYRALRNFLEMRVRRGQSDLFS